MKHGVTFMYVYTRTKREKLSEFKNIIYFTYSLYRNVKFFMAKVFMIKLYATHERKEYKHLTIL
jgi:hypothetical protein